LRSDCIISNHVKSEQSISLAYDHQNILIELSKYNNCIFQPSQLPPLRDAGTGPALGRTKNKGILYNKSLINWYTVFKLVEELKNFCVHFDVPVLSVSTVYRSLVT